MAIMILGRSSLLVKSSKLKAKERRAAWQTEARSLVLCLEEAAGDLPFCRGE